MLTSSEIFHQTFGCFLIHTGPPDLEMIEKQVTENAAAFSTLFRDVLSLSPRESTGTSQGLDDTTVIVITVVVVVGVVLATGLLLCGVACYMRQ